MNRTAAAFIIVIGLALLAAGLYWSSGPRVDRQAEHAAALQEGIALFEQEDYSGALQRLQDIPTGEADDWRLHYHIGSAYMMQNDYIAAAEALEQALALSSQQTGVLYALGVCYYKQGKLALAKGYFAAVLDINPNDEHAKGLMDIMSRLEQQSGAPPQDGAAETDG